MIIPQVINDAIVRVNGSEELIGIATVTLPDIENKTEEVEGLGIGKHEAIVTGDYAPLSLTLKFMGITDVKFPPGKVLNLIIKAVVEGTDQDSHETIHKPLTVSLKGKVKSSKIGDLGRGVKVEPEKVISCTYYKEEFDGNVRHEIDVFNKKAIVDGENLREAIDSILN